MGVDTHKVEIVPVEMEKHPDADSLSIVRVYNFTCVVRTADWEGVTKAAYVQPDSVLPDTPEFRYLKITGNIKKERDSLIESLTRMENEPFNGCRAIHQDGVCDCAAVIGERYKQQLADIEAKIDGNTKYLRVAVRKLRGVISMGMLLPCPEGAEIGDDVAELLGITHYEPPTMDEIEGGRKHAGDDVASPPSGVYAPMYDVESVYKYANLFEPGELVYVSEKLDGQNARFVASVGSNESYVERSESGRVQTCTNVDMHAGSRKEWKKKEGGSNWWRVQDQNPWIPRWCFDNQEQVLYGENFGWVGELKYGSKQGQLWFRAFDILNGSEWMDAEPFRAALHSDVRVPDFGIMPFDFEKLQKLADGPSLIPGANHMREGIVIKPLKERRHYKLGRVMVKMVSNAYLEKKAR
jgi:RNA ligase (TIGR02306 family)